MKGIYNQFFKIIKGSLYNEKIRFNCDENINWNEIFNLANIHKVLPLVNESIYKSNIHKYLDENTARSIKIKSMEMVYNQVQRSSRFLELYEKFNENNINVLVFKGIILRELYPIPDERISGDEDILIEKDDLKLCFEILEESGLIRVLNEDEEDDVDVYHYFCNRTGLHLELHTSLFGKDSSSYSHMNKIFQNVFKDSETININNIDIHTFSMDKHFLYIICHAIKHFVSCGTGIRQICDISMYIDKHHENINWDYIWREVTNLGYDTLLVNLLQIAIDYLGLDENKIVYQKNKSNYYIDTENLIEDIMDAGIYGTSTQARLNAANMSLDALNKESNSKIKANLAAIFPKAETLKGRYKYLNKYPFMLPIAWINRICTYIKERNSLTDVSATAKETIAIGNRRIDLLKEYKIIK